MSLGSELAFANEEIERLRAELRVTDNKLEICRNDAIQCGDLAASRFERVKELEKALDEVEREQLLVLRNLDVALVERDGWKRQAEVWQKRGWELGKEVDVVEGFARRGVRLVYRFKMENSDRCAPWLDGETFPYTMADQLETDWSTFLNERAKRELSGA